MTQRLTLFEAAGPTGQKAVYDKITSLEAAFLKARKKKLSLDILSVGHGGTKEQPLYSLTAYFEPAQAEDVRFLAENINP